MPVIGEVRMFGGNFAPAGWAMCNGQLIAISQNDALFTLIGTTYGGDGVNTFGLPNLQSRVPVGTGQGPGLPLYVLGQIGGTEANTLTPGNIALHTHPVTGTAGILSSGEDGHRATPVGMNPAVNGDLIYSTTTDNTQMAPAVVNLTTNLAGIAGPSPVSNLQPYLAINFIICLEGIYPTPN